MIELSSVVSTIASVSARALSQRLEKSEAVIMSLKRLGLEPDKLPDDFEMLYVHALVEYAMFKPESVIRFFRHEFVRDAFQQRFISGDPRTLDREAEELIEWNKETRELGPIDFDPRREFASFGAVFEEMTMRARTPTMVRQDHKLAAIEQTLAEGVEAMLAKVDSLTLDEIRGERQQLNQLHAQSALQELILNLTSWFEALGFPFEPYTIVETGFFEWIINIPGRRGYERIFVRGVEGETSVGDVLKVRDAVQEHRADEGWVVSLRRKSQAAMQEAASLRDSKPIFCYTFDELLEQDANFTDYFDWLQGEIQRRGIDSRYVPLACITRELDSVSGTMIAESHYDEAEGWIEGYVTRWLHDPSKSHLSILGEFGAGKTWFALHYAWIAMKDYLHARSRGVERPRIPIFISLRDFAKAVSVESLLSDFFFRKHRIPIRNYKAFEVLNQLGKLLLIFDGFDEMAAQVDRQQMINNFWELAKVVTPGSKVILTCRTEHFPSAIEGRALLNAELKASTAALTGESPQFEELHIAPLQADQIRQIMLSRTDEATVDRVMGHPKLSELTTKPLMIELVLEALPDIEEGKPIDTARIFLYAARRKMERDIMDVRTFTSLADKFYFLCELSWEMLATDNLSINYRSFPNRLRSLFGREVQEQRDLDHWQYDMMAQTLLVRNAEGDYSPSHRSLAEFFAAYKLAAQLGVLEEDFIEPMRIRPEAITTENPTSYTWTNYFLDTRGETWTAERLAPLKDFTAESMKFILDTAGMVSFSAAALDTMALMVNSSDDSKSALLNIIYSLRGDMREESRRLALNIVGVLIRLDTYSLRGADLSNLNLDRLEVHSLFLPSMVIDDYDLSDVNFSGSSLRDSKFGHTILCGANFKDADLLGVRFTAGQFDTGSMDFRNNQLVVGSYHDVTRYDISQRGLPRFSAKRTGQSSWSLAHSPNGRELFVSGWGSFTILDSSSLEPIRIFSLEQYLSPYAIDDEDRENRWTTSFLFNEAKNVLFVGGHDGSIRVCNMLNQREDKLLDAGLGSVNALAQTSDNRTLISSHAWGLACWDIEHVELISRLIWELSGSSSDGNLALITTDEIERVFMSNSRIHGFGNVVYVPNTNNIAVASPAGAILLLRIPQLTLIDSFRVPVASVETKPIDLVCINRDGTLLCGVGNNHAILLDKVAEDVWEQRWIMDYSLDKPGEEADVWSEEELDTSRIWSSLGYHPRSLFFGRTDDEIIMVSSNGSVYSIVTASGQVGELIAHYSDLRGADFRRARGLTNEMRHQIAVHGGIVE